jgi:hypothetical protein
VVSCGFKTKAYVPKTKIESNYNEF